MKMPGTSRQPYDHSNSKRAQQPSYRQTGYEIPLDVRSRTFQEGDACVAPTTCPTATSMNLLGYLRTGGFLATENTEGTEKIGVVVRRAILE